MAFYTDSFILFSSFIFVTKIYVQKSGIPVATSEI
jgi:hypothetical protein